MKKTSIAIAVALAAGIAAVCIAIRSASTSGQDGSSANDAHAQSTIGNTAGKRTGAADSPSKSQARSAEIRRASTKKPSVDWLDALPEKDRRLASNVQSALDEGDFSNVLRAATAALNSQKAEVRQSAVEALAFFGEKSIAELTPFMADEDEDVAEAARNAWELALSEIDSPKERLNASILVLETITDKDTLDFIGAQFSNTAAELIDGASDSEKSDSRRSEIVEALADIIENGKKNNSDAGKEIYEDITGHEWISRAETRLYLSDPDNYETPEEREESAARESTRSSSRSSRKSSSRSGGASSERDSADLEPASDDNSFDDAVVDEDADDGEDPEGEDGDLDEDDGDINEPGSLSQSRED